MSRRCPRCGGRVGDGLFQICPSCGAAADASGKWSGPRDAAGEPTAYRSVATETEIFGAPPGVPRFAQTLTRLAIAAVIMAVIGGVGVLVFSATVGGESTSSSTAAPAESVVAASDEAPAAASDEPQVGGATTAAASAAAPTIASCTRRWNAAANADARDAVAALGARRARVRVSSGRCVVTAILPGSPATATRFTLRGGEYAPTGPPDVVPKPSARLDGNGRLLPLGG